MKVSFCSCICWLAARQQVCIQFSDTESVFLDDVALLLEIFRGSPFHLMTIWANTVHLDMKALNVGRVSIILLISS